MTSTQAMAAAMQAAQAGISSSAEHAESDAPGWSQRAYQAVKSCHAMSFSEWTMEEMRYHLHWLSGLDQPAELRAWGAVTQRLLRDGIIEPVGYAKAASSNGAIKRTYRLRRPQ